MSAREGRREEWGAHLREAEELQHCAHFHHGKYDLQLLDYLQDLAELLDIRLKPNRIIKSTTMPVRCTKPTAPVQYRTRKHITPKVLLRVIPKANLEPHRRRLEPQQVEHGITIVELWTRALDTVVDIVRAVLGCVDRIGGGHAACLRLSVDDGDFEFFGGKGEGVGG